MQQTTIGIGRALRRAREHLGRSIEQAARETRLRGEYLEALEEERFDACGGEVYCRSFLRSYARYLGLDGDKVVEVYDRTLAPPTQPPPVQPRPVVDELGEDPFARPNRPTWVWPVLVALIILFSSAAAGILSRKEAEAPPAPPVRNTTPPQLRHVTLDLTAKRQAEVQIVIDDNQPRSFTMDRGETRSFEGLRRIDVQITPGSAVGMRVNGHAFGAPPHYKATYVQTFEPSDFREEGSTGG